MFPYGRSLSRLDQDDESELDRWEDESELDRWEKEYQMESATLAASIEELKGEVKILDKLIVMSETILDSGNETKLRELKTDDNPLYLLTNMKAGHSGESGRFQRYKETAKIYSFILNMAGYKEEN